MSYAVMPLQDWQNIVDSVRAKTGKTDTLVSAQVPNEINSITTGGGAELNIAYGDTAPEDTSKLWVKTSEPSGVVVSRDIETGQGSGGVRTLTTTLPDVRVATHSVVNGNKIYLFGGRNYNTTFFDTIYCFNTEDETIETLTTTLPEARHYAATHIIGNKAYLIGGSISGRFRLDIHCFNIEDETIETLTTTFPVAMDYPCSVVGGTRGTNIYILGASTTTIYCFDTETEIITTKSNSFPHHLSKSPTAVVGSKFYMFGGMYSNSYDTTIYCFDTESETVSTLSTPTVSGAYNVKASAIGTNIYLFGGNSQFDVLNPFADGAYDTIYCFDTVTETFTTLPDTLPMEQVVATVQTVGNKIYLFGGRNEGSYDNAMLSTIYSFSEEAPVVPKDTLHIIPNSTTNVFPLINTDTVRVEIGVEKAYKGNAEDQGERVEVALYKNDAWKTI